MQKIKIWNIFDEEKIERGEMFPIEIDPVTTPKRLKRGEVLLTLRYY
jgi:hypothetical protein